MKWQLQCCIMCGNWMAKAVWSPYCKAVAVCSTGTVLSTVGYPRVNKSAVQDMWAHHSIAEHISHQQASLLYCCQNGVTPSPPIPIIRAPVERQVWSNGGMKNSRRNQSDLGKTWLGPCPSQSSHRQPWDGTWGLQGENPANACLSNDTRLWNGLFYVSWHMAVRCSWLKVINTKHVVTTSNDSPQYVSVVWRTATSFHLLFGFSKYDMSGQLHTMPDANLWQWSPVTVLAKQCQI
jgi:hypothetical protein